MKDKWLLVMAVVIVVFVLAGEAVSYWANPYNYSSDVTVTDGNITYTLSSPSSEFAVLAYDNGGFEPVTQLYVFIDGSYGGQPLSDQTTFLNQINKELEIRGQPDAVQVNAEGLKDLMSGPGSGKGVLMLSGAFPDTVYTGSAGDPLFTWLDDMGSIYWMNGQIGHLVSHSDGTTTALDGTDVLFFGMEGAVRTSTDNTIGMDHGQNRDIGEMLCVNNGVRAGDVTNGLNYNIGGKTLSIGFSDSDGYGSITLTDRGEGKGMIAVFGGGLIADNRVAVAQVVASGISYDTVVDDVGYQYGVVNGTYNGTVGPVGDFTSVYIFFGQINTVYGKLTSISAAET